VFNAAYAITFPLLLIALVAVYWRQRVRRDFSERLPSGGLIGFQAAMPPWGVVLGLAVAAVGVWLIRQDRMVR